MRYLYLLRHAKSSWDDPSLEDHDRPLTSRGRKAARAMGRFLLARPEPLPRMILSSTSMRTRQTCARLTREWPARPTVRFEPALYPGERGDYLAALRTVPRSTGSAMLIGHNPDLHELAVRLDRHTSPNLALAFPTAALAIFETDGAIEDIVPDTCRLTTYQIPRTLQNT